MPEQLCNASTFRHSLLQPTAAIALILKACEDGQLSGDACAKACGSAARAATELQSDLDSLSNFLVLEFGDAPDPASDVDLRATVLETIGMNLTLNAASERFEIFGMQEPCAQTHPDTLKIALGALLKNAIEFSDEAVAVDISIEETEAVIAISDRGIGIAQDVIERLGEPFVVRNAEKTRRANRLGLGLAAAKRAAERLGGSLDLAAREDGGTKAVLRFPLPA